LCDDIPAEPIKIIAVNAPREITPTLVVSRTPAHRDLKVTNNLLGT